MNNVFQQNLTCRYLNCCQNYPSIQNYSNTTYINTTQYDICNVIIHLHTSFATWMCPLNNNVVRISFLRCKRTREVAKFEIVNRREVTKPIQQAVGWVNSRRNTNTLPLQQDLWLCRSELTCVHSISNTLTLPSTTINLNTPTSLL